MDRIDSPFRRRFEKKKKTLLFICTGDTCRSPMAAGYFSKLLDENDLIDLEVRSAGVMTVTGLRASQEAQQVMESEVVDLNSHRSSQLSADMIRRADLILGMSPLHVQTALRMQEGARGKTHLFKEYTKSDLKNIQIADPMGCTLEVFKKCFEEVKAACDLLLKSEFVILHAKKKPPEPVESAIPSEEDLVEEPSTEVKESDEPAPAEQQPAKKDPENAAGKKKAPGTKKAAGPNNRAQKKVPEKKRAAAKSAPESTKKTTKKKSAAKKKSPAKKKTPTKKKSPAKKKAPAAKKKKKSGRKTSSRR